MLNEFRTKKIYIYVLAVIAFFILLWGAIDTVSAGLGLALIRPQTSAASIGIEEGVIGAATEGEVSIEALYQRRMFFERIADSLARLAVGGGVFIFLSFKIKKEEKA